MFGFTRLSLVALFLASSTLADSHMKGKRRHSNLAQQERIIEERSAGNETHTLSKRAFTGRGTYYYVGLGACGTYSNDNDYMVALNGAQYGGGYPGPQCFKSITVQANGVTVGGIQVLDECPSSYCNFGDLDLSPGLFSRFADHSAGTLQITWWFDGDSPAPAPKPSPEPAPTSKWVAPSPAWTPEPSPSPAWSPSPSPPPPPPPPSSTSIWVAPSSSSTSVWVAPSSTSTVMSSSASVASSISSAAVNSTNPYAIVSQDNSTSVSISMSASAASSVASAGTGGDGSVVITESGYGNLVAINGLVASYGQLIVVGAGGYI